MSRDDFSQFSRFPAEIQITVWECFIRNEAASRLVIVNEYTGLGVLEEASARLAEKLDPTGRQVVPRSLRIMPSKCLVSPLLSVDSQARAIALEQYRTRIDIFDVPLPLSCPPRAWTRIHAQSELWDRRYWCEFVDRAIVRHARGILRRGSNYTPAAAAAAAAADDDDDDDDDATRCSPRGCVHLNLATDRFLKNFVHNPQDRPLLADVDDGEIPEQPPITTYGMRALADALAECQAHGTRLDPPDLLKRLRPAPLRYASAGLPGDVLGEIRHLVFCNADPRRRRRRREGRPPENLEFNVWWLWKTCPRALEEGQGAEGGGRIWLFDAGATTTTTTTTMTTTTTPNGFFRAFFDDVEEAGGVERLGIRRFEGVVDYDASGGYYDAFGNGGYLMKLRPRE